jgi:hypothetical protein
MTSAATTSCRVNQIALRRIGQIGRPPIVVPNCSVTRYA